jgi:mannose-6-phosphate isomerase-like protein (cupin superfamily)
MSAIERDELPYSGHSHELEGYLHGNVPATLIFFNGPPGSGAKLHRHPYLEIFVIQQGCAAFTVGDALIEAGDDQILIAPAGVPHKFTNTGSGALRVLGIQFNERYVAERLED